jgi:hypothetical protein
MATTDTSADKLFEYRLSMMISLGFNMEEALTLTRAKKTVVIKKAHRTYEHQIQVQWHDVDKLKKAGATNEQIIKILG